MILQMVWNECVRFWWTCKKTSLLQDLTVGSTNEGFDFAQSTLLSRRVVLKQLWTQCGLGCLGVKTPLAPGILGLPWLKNTTFR
jgi:hypothetical protein